MGLRKTLAKFPNYETCNGGLPTRQETSKYVNPSLKRGQRCSSVVRWLAMDPTTPLFVPPSD